jgi:uncharacterized protein (UPF0332 family)
VNEEAGKLLDKAARSIQAARTLIASGDSEFAAGRAYYGMFYAAEALLVERGLRFRKHGAVHAAFGTHFAKPGLVDSRLHRWLLDAFDRRLAGDYGVDITLTANEVSTMVDQAQTFLDTARILLDRES